MELKLVWVLVMLQSWLCHGCLEEERSALLELKSLLRNPAALHWTEFDCCQWKGVECNRTTRQVEKLSLGSVRGCERAYYDGWFYCFGLSQPQFNASIFLPFQQLRSLNLSANDLYIDFRKGFERKSTLWSCLEVLDLSFNYLHESVSASNNLTSLRFLSLERTRSVNFSTFFGFEKLSTESKNLEVLDLSFSSFMVNFYSLRGFSSLKSLNLNREWPLTWESPNVNGTLDFQLSKFQLSDFPYLKNLEHLSLDRVPLSNTSLQTIGTMKSLRTLSLHGCQLNGVLPSSPGICDLIHVRKLDLSQNHLYGALPSCFANLTRLHWLDLSDNHIRIPFSLEPFLNLPKLKYVGTKNNEIYAETESDSSSSKFQLESLNLVGHGYVKAFPRFIYHQYNLRDVVIANIKMEEDFPSWLLENNTKLERLSLVNLSLSGPLWLPVQTLMHLSYLDVSNNFLFGQIPMQIGAYFPKLEYLNMSLNHFSGSIPFSLGGMNLSKIDLSSNQLSGKLPEQLATSFPSLNTLILSHNRLEGQILSSKPIWQDFSWLQLDNNYFSGGIPDSLSNISSLKVLDISDNQLSGRIPGWMGNMLNLQALDLSRNNFTGSLPLGFSPPNIAHVHLSNNGLHGSLKDAFQNSSVLITLDLGHNLFSGTISNWLSYAIYSLNYLLLNNNMLEGEIPIQFCDFTVLRLIDISHNKFSGQIFPCLNHFRWEDSASGPIVGPEPLQVPLGPASSVAWSPVSVSPQEPLPFTTKGRPDSYRGKILEYMSGIDLSCNKLTGEIPVGIGIINEIRSLNLSHNSLTGSIPATLSQLRQIESLDLSNNSLDGAIPSQLAQLYSLEVFNVSYNNLSGRIPDRKFQFGTFEENSYYGNPLLCGLPLVKSCEPAESQRPAPRYHEEEDSGWMDMEVFYVSFVVTYLCFLGGIAAVLYINSCWRRRWLYFVSETTETFYYFIIDNIFSGFPSSK